MKPLKPLTAEQSDLVAANIGLAYWYANLQHRYQPGVPIDELVSSASMGLCRAAAGWNPLLGTFATYAQYAMRSEQINEWKRRRRMRRAGPPVGAFDEEPVDPACDPAAAVDMRDWLDTLPDREWTILSERLAGRTLKEIALDLGISFEWVRKLGRRAVDQMI